MNNRLKFLLKRMFPGLVLLTFFLNGNAQTLNDYAKGQRLHRNMEFDSAIVFYQRYLTRVDASDSKKVKETRKRIAECESGKRLSMMPRDFVITNLGPEINSASADYAPVLNEDETLLVFTSRRPDGNLSKQKSEDGDYFEDIFFSIGDGMRWAKAQPMSSPINTPFHNSNLAVSADGKQLFLYNDANEGDILVSELANGKWSQPKSLPYPVNTRYHESSLAITADGNRMFVASERPGGLGGSDIYIIEKNPTGQWGSAKNLGPSINTEWDEDSPFIDYDQQALYFSSNGHNSIGGYDIFRSLLKNGIWMPAENLGLPINTTANDSYFVSTDDGKRAYYSSVREGGSGQEDIYLITLPKELIREEAPPVAKSIQPEISSSVSFRNLSAIIYFESGSSRLSSVDQIRLNQFLEEVKKIINPVVVVDGHTDNTGSERINNSLSLSRSNAVKTVLTEGGLNAEAISINAWGETMPIASNDDEKEGRELNRRVVVRVISN
jgi:outer membrane protein OmpA-like peptidoglycan-associated protein